MERLKLFQSDEKTTNPKLEAKVNKWLKENDGKITITQRLAVFEVSPVSWHYFNILIFYKPKVRRRK